MTLILSNQDVQAALTMQDCVEVLEQVFADYGQGQASNRPRSHTYTPMGPGRFYLFKSMDGSWPRAGVHALRFSSDVTVEAVREGVLKRTKDPVAPGGRWLGLVLLFSLETTELLAIIQDGYLQRMRVGATSAVAARHLAPPGVRVGGMLGTGWQAGAQLLGLRQVLPAIERFYVFSPDSGRRQAFAAEWTDRLGVPVVAVDAPEQAVEEAQLLVGATNALEPVIFGRWLKPGMHVNSVQGHELDGEVLERADLLVVRDREQPTFHTAGDLWPQEARGQRRFTSEQMARVVTLGEVVCGRAGRRLPHQITVFGGGGMGGSGGLGIQFAAVAARVYEKARAAGLGREVPTDWFLETMKP